MVRLGTVNGVSRSSYGGGLHRTFSSINREAPCRPRAIFIRRTRSLARLARRLAVGRDGLILNFENNVASRGSSFCSHHVVASIFNNNPCSELFVGMHRGLDLYCCYSTELVENGNVVIVRDKVRGRGERGILSRVGERLSVVGGNRFSSRSFRTSGGTVYSTCHDFGSAPSTLSVCCNARLANSVMAPSRTVRGFLTIAESSIGGATYTLSLSAICVLTKASGRSNTSRWHREGRGQGTQ